jgi:hypothetical protein
MATPETRADRFARELADLKISDPAKGHPRLWQNTGVALQAMGVAAGVAGYLISQRTGDALTASTAISIALGGVILAVVGSAIFLRYSLTGFLRFWLARQSFELSQLAERGLAAGLLTPPQAGPGKGSANSVTADKHD